MRGVDDQLAGVVLIGLLGGRGLFRGGCILCGRSILSRGCGRGGLAAGAQRERHAQSQKQCKKLLHLISS